MIILYFSGTGNSKYIARLFARKMGCACHSIEESIDFVSLIEENETIAFCYPIYGSCVPKIMRKFATQYHDKLVGKKIIIFCTQYLFSGDGARIFTANLPPNHQVIYAEHFFMPNNIGNFCLLTLAKDKKIRKYLAKADRKMTKVCQNIKNGILIKRGFNPVSHALALLQRPMFRRGEYRIAQRIQTSIACNGCGLCASICPTNNLAMENGKVIFHKDCTLCYRCVNACPQKAITVFVRGKVKRQYKGVGDFI